MCYFKCIVMSSLKRYLLRREYFQEGVGGEEEFLPEEPNVRGLLFNNR